MKRSKMNQQREVLFFLHDIMNVSREDGRTGVDSIATDVQAVNFIVRQVTK